MSEAKTVSNRTLIELAKICKSVYGSPINHKKLTINNENLDFQRIIHGSFGRGFCRLFWNSNYVVIAFRGTRELVDWRISNLNFFPVNLRIGDVKAESVKVHFGFQKALHYIDKTTRLKSIDSLFNHLETNDLLSGQRRIILTGHSLGGAIATLFSVNLRFRHQSLVQNNLESIILFGSPAVGFEKFKNYYGELNSKTLRIINGSDIVPFTPPIFFRHIGKSVWYNQNQIHSNASWLKRLGFSLRLPLSGFLGDHSMENYIETLKKVE